MDLTNSLFSPSFPFTFLLAFCTVTFKWFVHSVLLNITSKSRFEKQESYAVGKLKRNWHTNKRLDSNFNTAALMWLFSPFLSLLLPLFLHKALQPAAALPGTGQQVRRAEARREGLGH